MREVDSRALSLVAGALGVGNPATAVEQVNFDDGVLQQVFDTRPLVPGFGLEDGFFGATQTHQHVATGVLRNELDIYARIESPTGGLDFQADRNRAGVWILSVAAWAEDTGETVDEVQAGLTIPATATSPFPGATHEHLLLRAVGSSASRALTAGGFLFCPNDIDSAQLFPIFVPRVAALALMTAVTIAANPTDMRVAWLLWAGPRGMPPPGA